MKNDTMKKYFLTGISVICCAVLSACGSAPTSIPVDTTEADSAPENAESQIPEETPEPVPETAAVPIEAELEFENSYSAQDGQAYLSVTSSDWLVQYWGKNEGDGYALSYNAGIADIQGDGYYVVSVNTNTNGFRYAMTGDVNQDYPVHGLGVMSVIIPNGEKIYPNATITISSVKVDGQEVELIDKNFTMADGDDTKACICVLEYAYPPQGVRTEEGPLFDEDGDETDIYDQYSGVIVNREDFEEWKSIEVAFNISGTGSQFTPDFAENPDAAVEG